MLSLEERKEWIQNKKLEDILKERDKYEVGSINWLYWNDLKAEWLERQKPSNAEEIIYFQEESLRGIPLGFTPANEIPDIPFYVGRRSVLEYHPNQRHPIPYAIVRFQERYFFILREKGSGEARLIGKKGMLGGHVGKEDIDSKGLSQTVLKALLRELSEEAGIGRDMIQSIHIRGLLKSNEGVDADHLGIIYEIELNTDKIASQEDYLKGIWIHQDELADHYNSFESWAKIVYDYLLKK